jgi:hypothetical protein
VQYFGRVFLMLNYNDITQNTYIQSWTVTVIMAIKKCGLLWGRHTVRRPWCHTRPLCRLGNETSLAGSSVHCSQCKVALTSQDNWSAAACVKYLET